MYILENALRNVLRNRGRNLLIGSIIFAVIVATVITLMINNTSSRLIDDYKERFGAEVVLQPDIEKIREAALAESANGRMRIAIPSIPPEQYIVFGESEYLRASIYTSSTGAISDDVTAIDAELGGGGAGGMMIGGRGPGGASIPMEDIPVPMAYMFNLMGNEFTEFEDGTRVLADGAMPSALDECIISADLAALNELSVGDIISFKGELRGSDMTTTENPVFTLTIVGIYDDATDEYAANGMENAYTNRRNEILMTYETLAQVVTEGMSGVRVTAAYFLKDPSMLDAFAAELYEKGLADTFVVTTDEDSFTRIVGPVEGLKKIAVTFLIVVLVFGGLVISLLASIAIRERKYEIGVLRTMGMKKRGVALGLWAEMLIVTMVCLVLGLGIGAVASQPVTDTLLESQIAAAQTGNAQQPGGGPQMIGGGGGGQRMGGMYFGPSGGGFDGTDEEAIDNLNVSLGVDTMLQITGIALLLATLAGLVSISRITKSEPIQILMERN